jgi:large subunit ribosomal protein L24
MKKIRKGDQVVVTTGKDKGKRGTVLKVLDTGKVVVEGVNRVKRHTSNVALFNPATGKGGRVGIRVLDDGRKVRYFKSNGEVADA